MSEFKQLIAKTPTGIYLEEQPNCDIASTYDLNGDEPKYTALFAAAPDLYESLLEILNYEGGATSALEDEYVVERAMAALEKAVITQ